MNSFISNLLNPPEVVEKGQIWRVADLQLDFVITDTEYLDELKVIRAAVFSRSHEVGDENDLVISPDEHYSFIPSPRVILRITDSPFPAEKLSYYLGSLKNEDIARLNSSLAATNFNYHDAQRKIMDGYLDKINPLRMEALKLYESIAEAQENKPSETGSAIIYTLPPNFTKQIDSINHEDENIRVAALAADSKSPTEKLSESLKNEQTVYEDDNFLFTFRLETNYFIFTVIRKHESIESLQNIKFSFIGTEKEQSYEQKEFYLDRIEIREPLSKVKDYIQRGFNISFSFNREKFTKTFSYGKK